MVVCVETAQISPPFGLSPDVGLKNPILERVEWALKWSVTSSRTLGNTCSPPFLAIFPARNFEFVCRWFGSRFPAWKWDLGLGRDRTGAGAAIAPHCDLIRPVSRCQSPIISSPSVPSHQRPGSRIWPERNQGTNPICWEPESPGRAAFSLSGILLHTWRSSIACYLPEVQDHSAFRPAGCLKSS